MNRPVLLLGGSGYVGAAFAAELSRRHLTFRNLARKELDYTSFSKLRNLLRDLQPAFLINCAGYTGKPNVDACEEYRAETLLGNVSLPQTIADACEVAGIPWGHVSSGCIYTGAKVRQSDGTFRIEPDLTRPDLRRLVEEDPARIAGFTESDPPNFSFRSPPCSFYSGTKALGEEVLAGAPGAFVWRLRIPFDEVDGPRNYLTKLQRYSRVYDNVNSVSHLGDFARACVDLWHNGAAPGTYNVTNPGFVTSRQVVELIRARLNLRREFEFWESDEEFYRVAAKTPRSNCVMDASKLLAAGVVMRPVLEAISESLDHWRTSDNPSR